MTRGRDGRAPRTQHRALLAAVVAAIVALSAAIFVGVEADDGTSERATLSTGGRAGNPAEPASTGTWVGAWSTSPAGAEPGTEITGMAGRSVRNVVHATTGGRAPGSRCPTSTGSPR